MARVTKLVLNDKEFLHLLMAILGNKALKRDFLYLLMELVTTQVLGDLTFSTYR